MPEGTRVHRCVTKLKGKRGLNPYAVCQASTGQGYATGKPLKRKRAMDRIANRRARTYR
jgi:hypothetical protein